MPTIFNLFSRALFLVVLLGLGSCMGEVLDDAPHSDIFFVNNTRKPLSVQVEQVGEAGLLLNEHYFIYEETIPAYATQRILRINRQLSVTPGREFIFTAKITGENSQFNLELQQKVMSLESDSSFSYGVTDDDLALYQETDTRVHRTSLRQANGELMEVAFKAKDKGTYVDVDYVLSEPYQFEEPDPSADNLSVLTYNIWALPLVSSSISTRLHLIPEYLQNYDVLLLQEAFSGERRDFLSALELDYGYSYVSDVLNKPGWNFFDGGVVMLSRYPIVNHAQAFFPDCAGADCFADKGINYIEVVKQGRSYHLFSSHTSSFDSDIARLYRQNQFEQMRDFAQSLNIPKNETVIYGGDFNVNKLLFPGDYQQMLATLNASEPQYIGHTAATLDPFKNVYASAFGSGAAHLEYLDYVLVSNDYVPPNSIVNNVRVPRSTAESAWGFWDLSDHFPVEAFIE